MPGKLIMFRGLPGSGKTTRALRMLDGLNVEDPGSAYRLNRDDLRAMLAGPGYGTPSRDVEDVVTEIRDAALGSLLRQGKTVIVDDTNLGSKWVRPILDIAAAAGAPVKWVDLTSVPLYLCVRQAEARAAMGGRVVPAERITSMNARYLKPHRGRPPFPTASPGIAAEPPDVQPYHGPEGSPRIVLCDIDGTLALNTSGRSWYPGPGGEDLCDQDTPNAPVIAVLNALAVEYPVVFMSGRTEGCRDQTERWLDQYCARVIDARGTRPPLFMRAAGDNRPDSIVKRELFDAHIRDQYRVVCVLDDRNSVVALWRSLGLACLQCADGAF